MICSVLPPLDVSLDEGCGLTLRRSVHGCMSKTHNELIASGAASVESVKENEPPAEAAWA